MGIYYLLMIYWATFFVIVYGTKIKYNAKHKDITYTLIAGTALFLIMSLKHFTVGGDWEQYLFRYNREIFEFQLGQGEWLYNAFTSFLKKVEVTDQGFIAIVGLIISFSFSIFFYHYSKNLFLSFYLHLTIGIFAMSMSGIRQTLAICLILFAFSFLLKNYSLKSFLSFLLLVFLASSLHSSAICFLPLYFFKNIKMTKRKAFIILIHLFLLLFFRKALIPLTSYFSPEIYLNKYEVSTYINAINPLLVFISFLIPIACLILWNSNSMRDEDEKQLYSLLFLMSFINIFINIMSLNSSIIIRLSFYFVTFNIILIANVITKIRGKNTKLIALYLCILLPLIQFSMATPNSSLKIDNYLFFWNGN